MSWNERIINDSELAPYFDSDARDFTARTRALIRHQQDTWPMLKQAAAALESVQYKRFEIKGAEVFTQFNPARIVSTAAKVDAASIKERPCFLCPQNLPAEEKGIAFGDQLVVLCNPFPVLKDHLVISAREHTPQTIIGNFEVFLNVTRELGEEFFTLYNGPACGASAPDHLHFQACSRERLPIRQDVEKRERRYASQQKNCEVFALADYRLNVIIARGDNREALVEWFEQAVKQLAEITETVAEPMLNLLATHDAQNAWTVYFFPRERHRPACYFAEDDKKLTVSPAGIDLGGVLVVPNQEHFARITAQDITSIYSEVTLDDERFARLV